MGIENPTLRSEERCINLYNMEMWPGTCIMSAVSWIQSSPLSRTKCRLEASHVRYEAIICSTVIARLLLWLSSAGLDSFPICGTLIFSTNFPLHSSNYTIELLSISPWEN